MKYFLTFILLSTTLFASKLCDGKLSDITWFIYGEHYKACNELYDYEINNHFCPEYWEKRGMVRAYEQIIEEIED